MNFSAAAIAFKYSSCFVLRLSWIHCALIVIAYKIKKQKTFILFIIKILYIHNYHIIIITYNTIITPILMYPHHHRPHLGFDRIWACSQSRWYQQNDLSCSSPRVKRGSTFAGLCRRVSQWDDNRYERCLCICHRLIRLLEGKNHSKFLGGIKGRKDEMIERKYI